jgi:general secretion pathway protein M
MPAVFEPVLTWWGARTLRERRMLALMGALCAATAVWLGVVRPVLDWREQAADRRQRAAAALSQVHHDLSRLAGPTDRADPIPMDGLEPLVRRTTDAAGLTVSLAMGADGRLGFRLAAATSGSAFDWLSSLERDHRLSLCRLSVLENADATLNVEGTLAPGGCHAA